MIILQDFSEIQLFNAAKNWIESDKKNRIKHAAKLMEKIRFPLMSPTELITHVQVNTNFIKSV